MGEDFFGIKVVDLFGGFSGGVVYVAITRGITKAQMLTSIFIGVVSAGYLTPLITTYLSSLFGFEVTAPIMNGVAFLIGLSAISIIPTLINRVRKFLGADQHGDAAR